MKTPDNLSLQIKQCQEGDRKALVWLLEEYGPRLWPYFLRSCRVEADAEDLLQELFVKLLENIKGYRHEGKFEHWLFRIAANLVRDRARRSKANRPAQAKPYSLENNPEAIALVSSEKDPSQRLLQAEQIDQLREALVQLPAVDREMILLRHYGQMSFKELADQFEMPIGTVLAKVHRGLKRLHKVMTEHATQ